MPTTPPQPTILISLTDHNHEITQLAHTLNYTIHHTFIQHRTTPDVNYYIGTGKTHTIHDYLKQHPHITHLIINGELKPSQWFNLEKTFNKTVYDRIRIILEIFQQRAQRKEAQLQVKLAHLKYERPYVRELIHRTRAGEHPGYMAGGEYQVDDYYEMIKKQIKKAKTQLTKIQTTRAEHRRTRHTSGFYLISLAGYTNAGKSSLLNLLTHEHVTVEGTLFSTLSTTTRRISKKPPKNTIPLLITDTVGFIDDLPSWLIEAFQSTLEEIELADLVLLLLDISENPQNIKNKFTVSLNQLRHLNVAAPILIVLTKSDLIPQKQLNHHIKQLQTNPDFQQYPIITISTKNHHNITTLITTIQKHLPHQITITMHLPNNDQTNTFISELYTKTHVQNITYETNISITFTCNQTISASLLAKCETLNGQYHIISQIQKPSDDADTT